MHLSFLLIPILLLKESYLIEGLNCLTNIKISQLLRFKHSVELLSCPRDKDPFSRVLLPEIINSVNLTKSNFSTGGPSALPLTKSRSYPELWHEKPSKLQTLFQISITALAFLSFGGYLLCLIVQAIKSKGTTYFHPVAMATTTTTNVQLKKIKIFRRSRRMTNRTMEEMNSNDDLTSGGLNPEDLYKILLYFSEGYAGSMSGNSYYR